MGSKYVPASHWTTGFIAERGEGAYNHTFGGSRWIASGPLIELGNPVLLMCLDLRDPLLLSSIFPKQMLQFPLFSYINQDRYFDQQYHLDFDLRVADFQAASHDFELLDEQDRLPIPLPESQLTLRPMLPTEIPTDKDSYWVACDTFLGGEAFLRVGGPPVWLQNWRDVKCKCGNSSYYIASIGHEPFDRPKGYISSSKPFIVGELALYFFWCKKCEVVLVKADVS